MSAQACNLSLRNQSDNLPERSALTLEAGGGRRSPAKKTSDDETVDRSQTDEDSRGSRMGRGTAEQAAGRGSRERVHYEETSKKHGHASDSFRNAAQVGCEQEECKLAWRFSAPPVDDVYPKGNRSSVVQILIVV
jgi:hypothetical protein